jgi:hypothetical protein
MLMGFQAPNRMWIIRKFLIEISLISNESETFYAWQNLTRGSTVRGILVSESHHVRAPKVLVSSCRLLTISIADCFFFGFCPNSLTLQQTLVSVSLLVQVIAEWGFLIDRQRRPNPLKPSGYYMYHKLQHTKTLHSAHTVYLCSVWFSQ